jgi:hypothetical protein
LPAVWEVAVQGGHGYGVGGVEEVVERWEAGMNDDNFWFGFLVAFALTMFVAEAVCLYMVVTQ